jgi:uncharacterized protein involved in high-affinity Fe2+ transport
MNNEIPFIDEEEVAEWICERLYAQGINLKPEDVQKVLELEMEHANKRAYRGIGDGDLPVPFLLI